MRVHAYKRALRALGVAESFHRSDRYSTLAGVVMRGDMVIDGFAFGRARVGGDDATSAIVRMYERLGRDDVNVMLLSGAVISYYNVVDLESLSEETRLPVICLTYRESAGLEDVIRTRFPGYEQKLELYRKLGERTPLPLQTGKRVYARLVSIGAGDARRVVERFTLQGAVAEPVRVARLLARARRGDRQAVT